VRGLQCPGHACSALSGGELDIQATGFRRRVVSRMSERCGHRFGLVCRIANRDSGWLSHYRLDMLLPHVTRFMETEATPCLPTGWLSYGSSPC